MAERIVSPGVFQQENDLSFLPSGVSEVGAALIGPTTKGPALIPTEVTSYSDYEIKFGTSDGKSYIPYTLREYLKNSGTATIIRILGLGGYTHSSTGALILSGSYGQKVVAVLTHTTKELGSDLASSVVDANLTGSTNFTLDITGSEFSTVETYESLSFNSTHANHIGKLFSDNPNSSTYGAYKYLFFKQYADLHTDSGSGTVSMSFATLNLSSDYTVATTPWIRSQAIGGVTYPLFRFKTISHGNSANTEVKVGITSVKYASEVVGSDYGTFGIVVREVSDNDRNPVVLETYNNLTLDPDSPNYIAKQIGDKTFTYNTTEEKLFSSGDYDNKSRYIIVDIDANVSDKSYSTALVPHGFSEIQQPLAVSGYTMPTASMVTRQIYNSLYNSNIYFGFNFDFDNTDNANYLMPIATNSTSGSNPKFNLSTDADFSDQPGSPASASAATIASRKFLVPFQGGFDGRNPATPKYMGTNITSTNTMGYDCSSTTMSGSVMYNRALSLLEDKDSYDFNLLLTPGLTYDYNPNVIDTGINTCEGRGDAFYVFDPVKLTQKTLSTVVSTVESIDTSYAATYYPWIKVLDVDQNKNVWVPGSVGVASAIAYNDKAGYEWFAPAGLNRGLLNAVDVYYKLSQPNRDTLYEGRVNPIAYFPNEGIVVWGQKTLQSKASALDRVNVRRLLINLKKYISSTTKGLIFDQNVVATRNRFLNAVNPYMESIQQRAGLYRFEVRMDETNNPGDVIDRNEMVGEIWLQPTKTAEFIRITFNLTPTGASFGA